MADFGKPLRYTLPLLLFIVILLLLWRGLYLKPRDVPSPLINKPAPEFVLPNLLDATKQVSNQDFLNQVTLFNVWASWCVACAEEHANLVTIANQHKVQIIGLNYKDKRDHAQLVLKNHGNPYSKVAIDKAGDVAIDWGVYGAPETFIIDKKGIIRYKQLGPISMDDWNDTLLPLINKLNSENKA